MTDLIQLPDGTWAEPDPKCCNLGHPLVPGKFQRGWRPCLCGGHRTRYCEQDGHSDEESRWRYRPPLEERCRRMGARLMSPQGELGD